MISRCISVVKFYFLILFYSAKYLFYYFINHILHPNCYKNNKKISVPPKCLSAEENGLHKYAKLSNCKFHYVERGNRNSRLLLLIHGYPEFWYSWRFQLRNLSSYFHVVAIDMKGYGDSDKPNAISEYDIPLLVTEIHDFLTAIGKQKCSLVTHGMGGLIGWYFLNEYPDVVENYISIASPHPVSFMQELALSRVSNKGWYYFCPVPNYPEKEAMKDDLKVFDKMYGRMISSKRGNMTRQDIEAFKYTFSRIEDWVGPINYMRTMLLRQSKYKSTLKKSTVSTLFIVGNADPYCSLEMICKSSEYVDNFTLKIVEGGGHFLQQEMPNYINSLILDFLKSKSIIWFIPEASLEESEDQYDGSILKKMIGAGKTVWSSSKDAVSRGYNIPKRLTSSP